MNLMKLIHEGLILESACLILVLHIVLKRRFEPRKSFFSIILALLMDTNIQCSDLFDDLKQLDAAEPNSLPEAVLLRSKRLVIVRKYNTLKSRSVVFKTFVSILVVCCILAWRPWLLLSLAVSDLVTSRFREHIRYSFS
jgi:hypothetical protein